MNTETSMHGGGRMCARLRRAGCRLVLVATLGFPFLSAHAERGGSWASDAGVEEVRARLTALLPSGPRLPGAPANLAVEETVAARFAATGWDHGEMRFPSSAFLPGETRLTDEEGRVVALHPMHPTLFRPGNFTERAFETELIDLGEASAEDLASVRGLDLAGRLVLLDFHCGRRWQHLLRFGVRGFVFVGDERYGRRDAYDKVPNSEVSVPRFFVTREDGETLRERMHGRRRMTVRIDAEPSRWESRMLRNLWVLVPGTDPQREGEVVVLVAPMDTNGVVPGLAEGAEAGANLYLLLELLEEFRTRPPARTVLLAAINARTQHYLGDRVLGWYLLAPEADIEAVRNEWAADLRLQEMLVGHLERLRFLPETRDDDEAFLVALRTLSDDSIGRQVTVKDPLVSLSQRDVNQVRQQQLLRYREERTARALLARLQREASDPDAPERVDALEAARADLVRLEAGRAEREGQIASLINVLTLFNRVGIQTRLRDLTEGEEAVLRGYVETVVGRNRRWAELNRGDLQRSEENTRVREALAGRRVALVLSLEQVWTGNRIAFSSGVGPTSASWADRWGRNTTRLAAGMPAVVSGQAPNLLVDSLTFVGGLPERFYVPSHSLSIQFYQRARRTPALSLNTAFAYEGRGFTPADTLENLDLRAVAEVGAFLRAFLPEVLADPTITSIGELRLPPGRDEPLWSILVQAFKFDEFAAGVVPEIPVPHSRVVLTRPVEFPSAFTGEGVIAAFSVLTDERASGLFYGIFAGTRGRVLSSNVFAYDDDFVRATHALDAGESHRKATSDITIAFRRILSMVPSEELVVHDRADPSTLGVHPITVDRYFALSALRNSEPRRYGISGASSALSSKIMPDQAWGPVGFYLPEGERLKVLTGGKRLVLHTTEDEPEGLGFRPGDSLGPDFFARAVQDMDRLSRYRLRKFRGVTDELVGVFLARARAASVEREAAAAAGDHLGYLRALYDELGSQVKAYAQIASITNDMLKAVVFYMALLLPFCFFLQKLLFKAVRIESQMAIFALLFTLCYLAFRFIHPAFRVAAAPEAMFIAFVMGGLGLFVIWILHGRFEGEMRLLFHSLSGGEDPGGGVGASMVGQQAMLIGVSNMKRRRIRTLLTTATIVLVTFTMLAFTSVSKRMSPTMIGQGRAAPYAGFMVHWPGARRMDEASAHVLRELYTGHGRMLTRRWLLPTDPGQPGTFRVARLNGTEALVEGVLGLEMGEEGFLGPLPLVHGRFFSAPAAAEVMVCSSLAAVLGVAPAEVGSVDLVFQNRRLRLVGVLDDARLRAVQDINGLSILPIKQLLQQAADADGAAALTDADSLADESGVFYVETSSLLVMPAETARRMGAGPFSVSVQFPDSHDLWPEIDRLLVATEARCFVASRIPFTVGGEGSRRNEPGVYYVGGGYRTAIGGLAMLIVPLLIAATIILNTMLGSVFERKKEIAIYNAVGLNPTHIGLFFLAESFVYGIIGSVGGYIIGQGLSMAMNRYGWVDDVNLNFSSLSVAYVIVFTIGIVLLSTVYPAMTATKAAVPSGKRKWSMPPHDGHRMRVVFPFIYQPDLVPGVLGYLHGYFAQFTEASTGDLIAEPLPTRCETDGRGREVYRIGFRVALAPYDLGVTQEVAFTGAYSEAVGAYQVTLETVRESGQDSNWVATNKPFMERLRKLLLHWRSLKPAEHGVYVRQGVGLFSPGETHGS